MTTPEIAELTRVITELNRRVTRLEEVLGQRSAAPNRIHVVEKSGSPTLESRLGSQYLNRLGIIALLFGVSYFLHWAFSNNWIAPAAIVFIGLLGGMGVIGLGEWFVRRGYGGFGFSLKALGTGALYLSLWAAFQLYHLVPAILTFTGMIAVTAATGFMALVQNSEALAVLAGIGGFLTPLLISTGHNLGLELFAYMLVLCAGMLWALAFRAWKNLLLTTFIGCVVVSLVWFSSSYTNDASFGAFLFSTLLWMVFIAAPILIDRFQSFKNSLVVICIPPAASAAYLAAADVTLRWQQLSPVAIGIAIVLLVLSWRLRGRLRVVFFTLAVASGAFAVPIQLDTHWTTSAVWLTLGVVLMLFGFAKGLTFVRWNALVLIGITVLKLLFFDLSELEQGYRILALSVLGVALLALSFIYQRYWVRLRKD